MTETVRLAATLAGFTRTITSDDESRDDIVPFVLPQRDGPRWSTVIDTARATPAISSSGGETPVAATGETIDPASHIADVAGMRVPTIDR